MALLVQKSWHPWPRNLWSQRTTSSMGFYITTASPEAAGTILSTCSIQTETVVVGRLGCTLKMKLLVLCGTRTYLGVMAVGGGTTSVLIYCYIVQLLPRSHVASSVCSQRLRFLCFFFGCYFRFCNDHLLYPLKDENAPSTSALTR